MTVCGVPKLDAARIGSSTTASRKERQQQQGNKATETELPPATVATITARTIAKPTATNSSTATKTNTISDDPSSKNTFIKALGTSVSRLAPARHTLQHNISEKNPLP
eukprot:TRINITY_DN18336_c0_g2_i1.p1 TRINITY_DN18336_c0_g2~~TRINITY_DN18336_c0_g2_i1.p1  ORF type:complete len:108 (+),score=18.09 TRINITY_DN18336_c0_g2_i1:281-604(+)